jgi:uncharacterized protein YaiI (UPF0178 family)
VATSPKSDDLEKEEEVVENTGEAYSEEEIRQLFTPESTPEALPSQGQRQLKRV